MRSSPPSTLFRGWQRRVRSPLVWAGEYSYERDILRNIHPKNKAVVYAVRLVGCSQCPRSHALSPADHTRRAVLSTYKYLTTCQTRKCPSSHRDDQPGSAHTAYSRVCPSGWLRAPPLSRRAAPRHDGDGQARGRPQGSDNVAARGTTMTVGDLEC